MKSFYLTHKIKKLKFLYSASKADYGLMKNWQPTVEQLLPDLKSDAFNTQRLRLLLGVNRSGTTWMGEVLSRTSTPIRYFMEGLYAIKPPLQFTPVDDVLAIRYHAELSKEHPLVTAYKMFLAANDGLEALNLTDAAHRNDLGFQYCLTKQVHCILASEGLLKTLNTKAILLIRNPIYVVDSLMSRDHLKSYSLTNEWKYVRDDDFLEAFHSSNKDKLLQAFKELNSVLPNRYTVVLRKVLTVALINEMLVRLAGRLPDLCLLVRYEELLEDSLATFEACAKHFGLKWDDQIITFLEKTTQNSKDDSTRMPIFRDQKAQKGRPLKFITSEEAERMRDFLSTLDLYSYE